MFFKEIQSLLVQEMALLMKEEKLLSGPIEKIIKKGTYKKYFPHFFGHSLGLDVHDVVLGPTQLKEGFVLTMEPGLYLPPEDTSLPLELRGLGIRIEDDILITKTGAKVLSQAIPKEPEEITDLMRGGSSCK